MPGTVPAGAAGGHQGAPGPGPFAIIPPAGSSHFEPAVVDAFLRVLPACEQVAQQLADAR